MGHGKWIEVGHRVFHRRYEPVDVSVGVILCEQSALVIDTRNNPAEARELMDDVLKDFGVPIAAVVNTHAHYDHCFGNQVFADAGVPIYGHARLKRHFENYEGPHLTRVKNSPASEPDKNWEDVRLTPPGIEIASCTELELDQRTICLVPLAHGHTDSDLAVHVPDANVWFLGDVIEQSGPPMFGPDSDIAGWPVVLHELAQTIRPDAKLIPGHGDAVDRDFLVHQASRLELLAREIRQGLEQGMAPVELHFSQDLRRLWQAEHLASAIDAYFAKNGGV